jgi:anti-sigma-K factor RskA
MAQHRNIQSQMYDFILGRLSAQEQRKVEEHCRECAECRADLESLRMVINALPPPAPEPSENRDPQFWAEFADRVEERIAAASSSRRWLWSEWMDETRNLLTRSWKPVGAATAVLVAAILVFVLTRQVSEPSRPVAPTPEVAVTRSPDTTAQRFSHFLRKSNTLLVGLTNRKVSDDVVDLSAERDLSRQLVRESRELREDHLDPQATQLVGEMERVLIEIASRNETTDRDHFDLIRSGIRQQNLLFRVRMTESVYQLQAASYERIR